MQLNPWVFAILAWVIAAVIAACVTVIIKIIALAVQRKKKALDSAEPES